MQNFMGNDYFENANQHKECWMRLRNVYLYSLKEISIRTE
ncbi:hypothetical protein LEP1GSC194_3374 [Leptospira alstonii serovar Sichuan str. 79601]|uniref:Uncharacterized protein n=1 Tax=Leptospira alstonii serovar Sichuan str. 79601 TaxID=1218565 RepID=M6DBA4_9LEPT|nr:hypothetical protein LEP1GSC194_3374 [Leptospira alstonii serovar Sichuan str. 79601]